MAYDAVCVSPLVWRHKSRDTRVCDVTGVVCDDVIGHVWWRSVVYQGRVSACLLLAVLLPDRAWGCPDCNINKNIFDFKFLVRVKIIIAGK